MEVWRSGVSLQGVTVSFASKKREGLLEILIGFARVEKKLESLMGVGPQQGKCAENKGAGACTATARSKHYE